MRRQTPTTQHKREMEKSIKMMMRLALLCWVIALAAPAHGGDSPEVVDEWYLDLPSKELSLTELQFYYHEIRVGDNPTSVLIAQANSTAQSPTSFGATNAIDDPLTVGPDLDSQLVGYAQGIYSSVSQTENRFILILNFVFTEGRYNGSTLSVLGSDPIQHDRRELPILGGSGLFRLARGTIITHTISLDPATLNAVVHYRAFILHY